jgi:hypothetical protein
VRLRSKLILTFLCLVMMVGGAGGFGLFYINKVAQTSEVFSDVAAPLVNETMALVNSLQGVHASLLEMFELQSVEGHQAYTQKLDAFDAAFHAGLARLGQLIAHGKLDVDIQEVMGQQRDFVKQAQDMLALHSTQVAQKAVARQRLHDVETQRRELDTLLATFATESESIMSEKEDLGKIAMQTGNTTVEALGQLLSDTLTQAYPIVQGAYKLMRYLMQMQDTARAYATTQNTEQLATLADGFQKSVKAFDASLKKLMRRVNTEQHKQLVEHIAQGFAQLQTVVMADNGLFSVYRASLDANAAAEAQKHSLAETRTSLERALNKVTETATGLRE